MNISLCALHIFLHCPGRSETHMLNGISFQRLTCLSQANFIWKPRESHKSTSNIEIPVQGARENNKRNNFLHCNLYQQKSTQKLPKPSRAFLHIYCCRLSGRYTQRNIPQSLLFFSLSLLITWETCSIQRSPFTCATEQHLVVIYSPSHHQGTEITS